MAADAQHVQPGEHPAAAALLLVGDVGRLDDVREGALRGAHDRLAVARHDLDLAGRDGIQRQAVARIGGEGLVEAARPPPSAGRRRRDLGRCRRRRRGPRARTTPSPAPARRPAPSRAPLRRRLPFPALRLRVTAGALDVAVGALAVAFRLLAPRLAGLRACRRVLAHLPTPWVVVKHSTQVVRRRRPPQTARPQAGSATNAACRGNGRTRRRPQQV